MESWLLFKVSVGWCVCGKLHWLALLTHRHRSYSSGAWHSFRHMVFERAAKCKLVCGMLLELLKAHAIASHKLGDTAFVCASYVIEIWLGGSEIGVDLDCLHGAVSRSTLASCQARLGKKQSPNSSKRPGDCLEGKGCTRPLGDSASSKRLRAIGRWWCHVAVAIAQGA